MNAELEVQKAIYSLLTGQSPPISYPVYDDVPEDTSYPYVNIGEATSNQWDSKTFNGFETSIVIHSWSRYSGRKEIKEIMGTIYDILHDQSITVTGYNTVLCLFEFSETFLEDDGVTRHGVQRFNLIINEE